MNDAVLPGSTIGVLGSGQLGRMFAMAARRMGYLVHTFSPETDTPTGQISDLEIPASYDDLDAARSFARRVDVVTFEFENIPLATVEAVAEFAPVRPSGKVLHTAQHRLREKTFLTRAGYPVTPFRHVRSLEDLRAGLGELGSPAVLKTAGFGYDGKGQTKISSPDEAHTAFDAIGGQEAILEAFVDFEQEVSVIAARGVDGQIVSYGVIDNDHQRHILDCSVAPSNVPAGVAREAGRIAESLLEQLDVVGVLCVEFFLGKDGRLYVNEIAPRPHNSGHYTIDACVTSQFEQQLRAVCGLPLGATEMVYGAAAMANLLGDLWRDGPPRWAAACAFPTVKLHLYGKHIARPARKMGHLTAHASTTNEALELVCAARRALTTRDD
ncbi:MAG TPA: 5-(carboxyamino)imidazole ribonucleotide synthase [Pyrinomonadaceae bacterium]|nr:5-(carboxyamino)imidazole ribonucleotide synthase [Pyrinomonadaceae bacterium]